MSQRLKQTFADIRYRQHDIDIALDEESNSWEITVVNLYGDCIYHGYQARYIDAMDVSEQMVNLYIKSQPADYGDPR